MLTSLYSFGKKENGIWGKDVLFDSMDVVATIEEYGYVNKDDAVSVLMALLIRKMMTEIYFLIKVSTICNISGKIFWNEDEKEMNVLPLGVL